MSANTANVQPPPGGGGGKSEGGPGRSYSEKLKTNVNYNQRLKRNVLEISLERTEKDANLNVGEECMERVMTSIGIDINQPVGFQTKYRGNFIIMSVWFQPDVNLDRFCKDETIKVTAGVSTGYIRPAGRPEVVVTVSGLDFNTPDQFVIEYLNKFGNVVNKQPIYCKGTEGFMKNKYNGVRKYQVDFSKSVRQMGSYHFLDGEVVRINYRGNRETCGRCHQGAKDCPGGGKKKECKEKGGPFVHISDHMRELWNIINFAPTGFELPPVEEDTDEDVQSGEVPILDANTFPNTVKPSMEEKDIQKYEGITISNFPSHLSETDVLSFMFEKGLPKDTNRDKVEIVKSERNTKVVISDSLEWATVQTLLKNIHFHDISEKFWNVPLFCKPIRALTPAKQEVPLETKQDGAEHEGADQVVGEAAAGAHAQNVKPKAKEADTRPRIPGIPESERKKAEQASKRRKLKELKEAKKRNEAMDDFEFDNIDEEKSPSNPLSFTDIQNVFDKNKRKTVSPAESDKFKKSKALLM